MSTVNQRGGGATVDVGVAVGGVVAVAVGGTLVAVGVCVAVGGADVGVAVGGAEVAVAVGGTFVAVAVAVAVDGGTPVAVAVAVGRVAVGVTGVLVVVGVTLVGDALAVGAAAVDVLLATGVGVSVGGTQFVGVGPRVPTGSLVAEGSTSGVGMAAGGVAVERCCCASGLKASAAKPRQ